MRERKMGEFREVKPAVKGGDEGDVHAGEHRVRPVVDMEMQHVELMGTLGDVFDQDRVGRDPVADIRVEPECARPRGVELGRGFGVARGKQGDVMAEFDQRLGQRIDDALGAAVELGGHGLEQGRDLGNTHDEECLQAGIVRIGVANVACKPI